MLFGYNAWHRLWAVILKEFVQMKRDRTTFALIVIIPLVQVILFGYAINSDPKHLSTAVLMQDNSNLTRTVLAGLQNSEYFTIKQTVQSEAQAANLLAEGKVQFVINIPANFTRDVIRGLQPAILVEADATDPAATSNAISALNVLSNNILNNELQGSLNYLAPTKSPFTFMVHAKYNPSVITPYNIVPGIMGIVLLMTMVMITAIAITRERERGTIENLLAMPVQPIEVMIGKIFPYIFVGYLQAILVLCTSEFLFHIPIEGSLLLLVVASLPYIAANLALGLIVSTVAKNQLQAVQMTIFYFLPSFLLSGFMFPFQGMPRWAQWFGEVLPLTHYLRIVRGVLLKGNGWGAVWPEIWPMLVFTLVMIVIGMKRYHRTLD